MSEPNQALIGNYIYTLQKWRKFGLLIGSFLEAEIRYLLSHNLIRKCTHTSRWRKSLRILLLRTFKAQDVHKLSLFKLLLDPVVSSFCNTPLEGIICETVIRWVRFSGPCAQPYPPITLHHYIAREGKRFGEKKFLKQNIELLYYLHERSQTKSVEGLYLTWNTTDEIYSMGQGGGRKEKKTKPNQNFLV